MWARWVPATFSTPVLWTPPPAGDMRMSLMRVTFSRTSIDYGEGERVAVFKQDHYRHGEEFIYLTGNL